MKAFQEQLPKLEGTDTQVLGVSIDSPFSNHAFALENGITFPLLGDMEGKAIEAYGLLKTANVGGVAMKTARRATFLIDKEGKIVSTQVDAEAIDTTKFDSAIAASEKEVKAKPTDDAAKKALSRAYFERGVALTDARQYASALGDYRRAVKYDADNNEAKDWIDQIIMIYGSLKKEYPKEGEEPPPLPFKKT